MGFANIHIYEFCSFILIFYLVYEKVFLKILIFSYTSKCKICFLNFNICILVTKKLKFRENWVKGQKKVWLFFESKIIMKLIPYKLFFKFTVQSTYHLKLPHNSVYPIFFHMCSWFHLRKWVSSSKLLFLCQEGNLWEKHPRCNTPSVPAVTPKLSDIWSIV